MEERQCEDEKNAAVTKISKMDGSIVIDLTEPSLPVKVEAPSGNKSTNGSGPFMATTITMPSSASSSRPAHPQNPYSISKTPSNAPKFVGGAEKARRLARRKLRAPRAATAISIPGQNSKRSNDTAAPVSVKDKSAVLPHSMNGLERFFAALLRTPVHDLVLQPPLPPCPHGRSDTNSSSSSTTTTTTNITNDATLHADTCRRVGLSEASFVKLAPMLPRYETARAHFDVRAAAVLDEALCALTTPLRKEWSRTRFRGTLSGTVAGSARNEYNHNRNPQGRRRGGGANRSNAADKSSSLPAVLQTSKQSINKYGHARYDVRSTHRSLTRDELQWVRPGSVLLLLPNTQAQQQHPQSKSHRHQHPKNNNNSSKGQKTNNKKNNQRGPPLSTNSADPLHSAVLAVVLTGNRERVESTQSFAVLIPRPQDLFKNGTYHSHGSHNDASLLECTVTSVAHLVTELRCFAAVTGHRCDRLAFLGPLLGRPPATHTRFASSSSSDDDDGGDKDSDTAYADDPHKIKQENSSDDDDVKHTPATRKEGRYVKDENDSMASSDSLQESEAASCSLNNKAAFNLPKLNEMQEEAATTYLESDQNTITIVQGPPGTGKTTLLVSIICRYLMDARAQNKHYRLMVSAPTNKAIAVLATRFLAAVNHNASDRLDELGDRSAFNAILVGDQDKLLVEERSDNRSGDVKSIFLYTWIKAVTEGYQRIKAFFTPSRWGFGDSRTEVHRLARQLQARITCSLPRLSKTIVSWTDKISKALDPSVRTTTAVICDTIDKLLEELGEMSHDTVCTELMRSARVIFCTLASAGGNVLQHTDRIDDLIVDEAAAASEPQLYIPFSLNPTRLLVVGDPLQLPATVMSRTAVSRGLAKSLHERLMYDCEMPHIMLDVQYRMSEAIAKFPSSRFYNGQILNGPNVSGVEYQIGPQLLNRQSYTFLQVDGVEEQAFGGSFYNNEEAKKIVELVGQLQYAAEYQSNSSWHTTDRIRVITFYTAQVALIKRLLYQRGLGDKIVVATVDSSQGSEADTVLISFVRSNSGRKNGNMTLDFRRTAGFLSDDRRINVALTRAKYQLICVGNLHHLGALKGADTLQLLAADAKMRGVVHSPLAVRPDVNSRLDVFYGDEPSQQQPSKKLKYSR